MIALARGDVVEAVAPIPSPIEGVSDDAWTALVRALATASVGAVSSSLGLGMFELRQRRLGDLGIVIGLHSRRAEPVPPATTGRMVWEGRFVLPMTREWFLRNPVAQYRALRDSLIEYATRIRSGAIKTSEGLSGALGILHHGGEGALRGRRFPSTEAVFQRTKGLF